MSEKAGIVLVIDDDPVVGTVIHDVLEVYGYETVACETAESGLSRAVEEDYDLILVDLQLPDGSGADLIAQIRKTKPTVRIVMITGHPHDPRVETAVENGAVAVVPKPFDMATVLDHLQGSAS